MQWHYRGEGRGLRNILGETHHYCLDAASVEETYLSIYTPPLRADLGDPTRAPITIDWGLCIVQTYPYYELHPPLAYHLSIVHEECYITVRVSLSRVHFGINL